LVVGSSSQAGLDLFDVSVGQVRELMSGTDDPDTLRLLIDLEFAISSGDDAAQVEAVGQLGDLLVLERGLGF
jgi:hypothetical protein